MRDEDDKKDESNLHICAFRLAWVRDPGICVRRPGSATLEVARRRTTFFRVHRSVLNAFVDDLQRTAIDPSRIIPLYATMGKALCLHRIERWKPPSR